MVSKDRLQLYANKFSKAVRVGQLQYLDERELNEFLMAEVFEIDGFLRDDGVYDTCLFFVDGEASAPLLYPRCCGWTKPKGNHFEVLGVNVRRVCTS